MRKKVAEAFRSPFKDRRARMDLLVGGTLLAFPVAGLFLTLAWQYGFLALAVCLPLALLPIGYTVRRLQRIIRLQPPRVTWDEQMGLLIADGARCSLIGASYFIVPILLMALTRVLAMREAGGPFLSIAFLQGQLIQIAAVILFLVACFFLPAAVWMFCEEGTLAAGFRIHEALDRILLIPREYLIVYVVNLALFLSTEGLIILILRTPIPAVLIGGFIIFYDWIVSLHLLWKVFPRKSVQIQLPLPGTDSLQDG